MSIVPSTVVSFALKATHHLAAWLVWHSARVSLLPDLDAPRPPEADEA